jgi:glycosyltransferase involved in cell wall biosynthesis
MLQGASGPRPTRPRASARAELGIPPDATVIGFVGRLVRDKGVIELASAWKRLRDWTRAFTCCSSVRSSGNVLMRPSPRACCGSPRRSARRLTGVVDTPRLYAAMDVVALPDVPRGLPNVALEAAAMELPIVATAIPGCVDAILTA